MTGKIVKEQNINFVASYLGFKISENLKEGQLK